MCNVVVEEDINPAGRERAESAEAQSPSDILPEYKWIRPAIKKEQQGRVSSA